MAIGRWLHVVVLGIVLSIIPLHGAVYRSNSLGQKLELDDKPTSRYTLKVEGEHTNREHRLLYDGPLLIMEEKITIIGAKKEVERIEYDVLGNETSQTTTFFEKGLPQRILTQLADEIMITLHAYSEGRLVETKELRNGEMIRLITYYRGKEGMLSGLRVVDLHDTKTLSTFTKDKGATVYGESIENTFSTLTYFPHNIIVRNYWVDDTIQISTKVDYDEAGRLVVTEVKEGLTFQKTYGPDGMLLETHAQQSDGTNITQTYIYDSLGVLDQSIELIEGSSTRRIERWYKDGLIQTQTEWEDSQPVKATRYVYDGTTVVTLFEEGRPYADITYAPDGKRVLSLEYRKEK